MQKRIPYSASDHSIFPVVLDLFHKLYQRRLLVRLIGVHFSHLVEGGQQINLFEDPEKVIRLYQAMDSIRKRYGSRAVIHAVGLGARSIGRGNPFNGEAPPLLANRRS